MDKFQRIDRTALHTLSATQGLTWFDVWIPCKLPSGSRIPSSVAMPLAAFAHLRKLKKLMNPAMTEAVFGEESGLHGARLLCRLTDMDAEDAARGESIPEPDEDWFVDAVWIAQDGTPYVPYNSDSIDHPCDVVIYDSGLCSLRWEALDTEQGTYYIYSEAFSVPEC